MGSLYDQIVNRESSGRRINSSLILHQQCAQLRLSHRRSFQSAHAGGITWLALDSAEQRYLLAGAADATIAVYDTHELGGSASVGKGNGGNAASCIEPVCTVGRHHPGAHQYLVSCVAWYPADSGMFLSGSYDQKLKLWDTNTLEVVSSWHMPAKVSGAALSHVRGAGDGVVAVACQDVSLRLLDMRMGAFTHTLVGHRHPVWCVSWSARDEHQLASGDAHGQVCVWDIRRFGPTQLLDMYCTQSHRRQTSGAADLEPIDALGMADDNAAAADGDGSDRAGIAPGNDGVVNNVAGDDGVVDDESVMESAWRAVHEHRLARAGHTAASHASTGKRTRNGALSALRDLPKGRRETGGAGALQAALQQRAGSGSGSAAAQSSRHRLPLAASAPLRPGRTGEVIGGRAPQASGRLGSGGGLSDVAVRAHQGAVTCVLPTPDGLFWLSGGTDSRLRLWDALGWQRQLVGYTGTHNRALRARQLGVTQDGAVAFHPSGSMVQVFDVRSAALLCELSGGHTESINACVWNPLLGEVYTGANDCRILVWSPRSGGRSARETAADMMEGDNDSSEGEGAEDQNGGGRLNDRTGRNARTSGAAGAAPMAGATGASKAGYGPHTGRGSGMSKRT